MCLISDTNCIRVIGGKGIYIIRFLTLILVFIDIICVGLSPDITVNSSSPSSKHTPLPLLPTAPLLPSGFNPAHYLPKNKLIKALFHKSPKAPKPSKQSSKSKLAQLSGSRPLSTTLFTTSLHLINSTFQPAQLAIGTTPTSIPPASPSPQHLPTSPHSKRKSTVAIPSNSHSPSSSSTPSSPTSEKSNSKSLPSSSSPLFARSMIPFKDLSNLELIGEGTQGEVYKAQWKGLEVTYKKVKLFIKTEDDDKKSFAKEFSVWQYVSFIFNNCYFFLNIFKGMRSIHHACRCMV